jgi:hypothetical protein
MKTLVSALLMLTLSVAEAQSDVCLVATHSLTWRSSGEGGTVKLVLECRGRIEERDVVVQSVTELRAWSDLLRQYKVQARLLPGKAVELIAR